MSKRNTPANKSAREYQRRHSSTRTAQRVPLSDVNLDSSAHVLCTAKRLSGSARRALMRSRQDRVVMPEDTGRKSTAVRLFEKLASLPLAKVLRRQKQFARRAATAKHLLAKMDPKSPFRPALVHTQDMNLRAFRQATAEIKARKLHAEEEYLIPTTLAEQRAIDAQQAPA